MYPQGIQRIYAAESVRTLKRALAVMVFLPAITVLFAYFVGLMAIPEFAGLGDIESDSVMTRMLALWSTRGLYLRVTVTLLLVAALVVTALGTVALFIYPQFLFDLLQPLIQQ